MFPKSLNKTLMNVCGWALLINGFAIFAEYLAIAPIGTHFLLAFDIFVFLPLLAAFLAIPTALVLLCWRRYRMTGLKALLACIIYLIVGITGIRLSLDIRRNGFVDLANRSRSLVTAIKQFETKYEKPPDNLEQLVPEFLPSVPNTGIGAYPTYDYFVVSNKTDYEGNSWILQVRAMKGIMKWDVFLYFPKQNYPRAGYGGVIEPIEDWGYVHE